MKLTSLIAIATFAFSAAAFAQNTTTGSDTSNSANTGTSGMTSDSPSDTTRDSAGLPSSSDTTRAPSSTTDSTATTPSTTSNTTSSDTSSMSPKDVCQKIVQATKTTAAQKNQMDQWVYNDSSMGGHGKMMKDKNAQGRDWIRNEISSADCGTETIAGTHAFVVTKTPDRERLIPFVKQGNTWKLDVHAYRALYRMDQRTPASSNSNTPNSSSDMNNSSTK